MKLLLKIERKLEVSKAVFGFVLLLFSLFCTSPLQAQLDASVFQDFSQTIVNPYLINPAANDTSYTFKLRFNNINELGVLKHVNRFYLDGDKRFGKIENSGYHFAGAQVTNAKLGDYINKSSLQFRYAWFMPLSREMAISAGVGLGFVNFNFLTSQGGTGGSDYGPDGSLGLRYFYKKLTIGVAMQQIFSPVLQPVNQTFRQQRLYNIDLSRKFQLSPRMLLEAQGVVQFSEDSPVVYSASLLANYYDVALLGISAFNLKKTSVSAGVMHRFFYEYKVQLLATYSFYHSEVNLNDNLVEVYLSFSK